MEHLKELKESLHKLRKYYDYGNFYYRRIRDRKFIWGSL